MNKPAVVLCLLLLSGLSMALDGLSDDEDEEVRSKPVHYGNTFIVELFLKHDDEPNYSLNLTAHFPAAGQLLDINNGWYIYLLNEPVEGASNVVPSNGVLGNGVLNNNVPTMRLVFVESEDAYGRLSFDMQASPLGASNALQKLVQKFWPRKTGHFHFDLQVSGSDVSVDSSKTRQYEAARYIASNGQHPGRLQLYLPPVRQAAAVPQLPSHPKPRQSHFKEHPNKWVEVTLINDREDVEKGHGWYSVSLARLGLDKIDVKYGPVPESGVPLPSHNPGHISRLQSTYDVEFNDLQPSGAVYRHNTRVYPHTAIRARQSGLVGRVRDGILTLVIRRYRQFNFYNHEGQYMSRRERSIEERFIQVHYQRGRIGEVTGDYTPYVKKIIIRFSTHDAPASVTLVMNSQQEANLQLELLQQGIDAHPSVEVINAPPGMALGSGIDGVDLPSLQHNELPVWMLNAGVAMMGEAAATELVYTTVASPAAAGFF